MKRFVAKLRLPISCDKLNGIVEALNAQYGSTYIDTSNPDGPEWMVLFTRPNRLGASEDDRGESGAVDERIAALEAENGRLRGILSNYILQQSDDSLLHTATVKHKNDIALELCNPGAKPENKKAEKGERI